MGRVLASGTDLTAAGFTDFVFDILYISWFSLGLSILFDAAWWAMLVIPVFAAYKVIGFFYSRGDERVKEKNRAVGTKKNPKRTN